MELANSSGLSAMIQDLLCWKSSPSTPTVVVMKGTPIAAASRIFILIPLPVKIGTMSKEPGIASLRYWTKPKNCNFEFIERYLSGHPIASKITVFCDFNDANTLFPP